MRMLCWNSIDISHKKFAEGRNPLIRFYSDSARLCNVSGHCVFSSGSDEQRRNEQRRKMYKLLLMFII